MRRYIVDNLLSDPKNVVIGVDLLTVADAARNNNGRREDARYECHRIDVNDASKIAAVVAAGKPQAIINLPSETAGARRAAGQSPALSENILGTYHLLEAARVAWQEAVSVASVPGPRRFIHVSGATGGNYPVNEPDLCAREMDGKARPACPYDEIVAARLVDQWWRAYGLPALNVTAANTFGPFQAAEHFIPSTIDSLLRHRPVHMRCDKRDWTFVEDAADAVVFLSQHGVAGTRYGVDSIDGRFSELAIGNLICDQLDQIVPRARGSYREILSASPTAANEIRHHDAGVLSLRAGLGWRPLNDFYCALSATVRWYVEHAAVREQRSFVRSDSFRHAALR